MKDSSLTQQGRVHFSCDNLITRPHVLIGNMGNHLGKQCKQKTYVSVLAN
jgi:hypothetical protein